MSLQPVKTTISSGVEVFQKVYENAQGGFTLSTTGLTSGYTIPEGAPFGYNEATRVATLLKTAQMYASATNTDVTYQVKKGHAFATGDYLASVVGGKAYAITAIDTSNAAYDILTVGTTLAVTLSAGDVLFKSSATGASAAALDVTVKGLLYSSKVVGTDDSVSIALRATVYARRYTPGYPSAVQTALPNIIFSQSY
jgi:hypothetical protein